MGSEDNSDPPGHWETWGCEPPSRRRGSIRPQEELISLPRNVGKAPYTPIPCEILLLVLISEYALVNVKISLDYPET